MIKFLIYRDRSGAENANGSAMVVFVYTDYPEDNSYRYLLSDIRNVGDMLPAGAIPYEVCGTPLTINGETVYDFHTVDPAPGSWTKIECINKPVHIFFGVADKDGK